jgi:cytochrome c oxidase assembly factor CtaG
VNAPGIGSWSVDPGDAIGLIVAALAYAALVARARRLGGRVGPGHLVPFCLGWVALALALLSPLDPIGDEWLLCAHVGQHMLLGQVAPVLMVLGLRAPVVPLGMPPRALRLIAGRGRVARTRGALLRPWVMVIVWGAVTVGWMVPPVFDYASAHDTIHAIEHGTQFWAGMGLWWLVIDPMPSARRRAQMRRLSYLVASDVIMAVVSTPLTWLGDAFYPRYADAPRAFGLSAVADQEITGASMTMITMIVLAIAVGMVIIDILGREEEADRLVERTGAP